MEMPRTEGRDVLTAMAILILIVSPQVVLPFPLVAAQSGQTTPFVGVGDEAHYRATQVTSLFDADRGKIRTWTSPGFQVDLAWKVLSVSGGLYRLNVSYVAGPPASISRNVDVTLDSLSMNVTGPRSPHMHSFLWTLPGRHVGDTVLLGGNASLPIAGQVTHESNVFTIQGTQPVFVVDARIVEFVGYTFPLYTAFDSDTGLDIAFDLNSDGAFFQAGFIYASGGFALVSTTINLGPANWLEDIIYFLGTNMFAILLLAAASVVGFYFVRKWRRTYKEMIADRLAQKKRRSRGRGHGK